MKQHNDSSHVVGIGRFVVLKCSSRDIMHIHHHISF